MTNRTVRKKLEKLCRGKLWQAEGNIDEQQFRELMKEFRELYRKYKPPKEQYNLLRDWHYGYFYWLIPLWKALKKGVIQAAVYDSETAFKKIDTDGKKWFDIGGFKPPEYSEEKVKDFRYALLFKIAKLLYENEKE